ncbi:sensor histidine kinase [Pseudonocardia sp. TRM90224]|uniref:sensor histidine kinase n=1 Tax=Pseudonocardia sp. TRM90224 TaxID=2812678 RepID=UPI001E3639F8|nr:histidine kinase [Pseudonocardia sp. TRM90224]
MPELAPRFVQFVVTVVVANFAFNALTHIVKQGQPLVAAVIAAPLVVTLVVIQLYLSSPRTDLRSWRVLAAVGLQALLICVPQLWFGQAFLGLPGFLAGTALLVFRPVIAWPLFGVVVVLAGVARWLDAENIPQAVYTVVQTVLLAIVIYGLSRLRRSAGELRDTRTALADAAVTRERLRFAAAVRELVGRRISAITVVTELARRRLDTDTDEVREQLGQVLELSRSALADVRTVASTYRELPLDRELETVRSTLTAAGVSVTVRRDRTAVPSQVGTLLATVLREAVTNVLRHSCAQRCDIVLAGEGDRVVLDIGNDGVAAEPGTGGNALDALSRRAAALGGTLEAGADGPGRFRVRVAVPLRVETDRPERATRYPVPAEQAPRFATWALIGLLCVMAIGSSMISILAVPDPAALVVSIACPLTSLLLQLLVVSRSSADPRSLAVRAAFGAQLVLAFTPIVLFGSVVPVAFGAAAGTALLILRPAAATATFVALVASTALVPQMYSGDWFWTTWLVQASFNNGLEIFALTRLRSLVVRLHSARTERAALAVAAERLRFASDLHDLLGFSLSAITLKTELALRLVDIDPERADRELDEVLALSRQALLDARAVARSSHDLSLEDEASSAVRLLTAAGIDVTTHVDGRPLPADVRTVLATVLREGATNLLRHSKARSCEIVVARSGRSVTIEMVNDGAPEAAVSAAGTGIRNLTARVEALGGRLDAGRAGETTYRLHAAVPLPIHDEVILGAVR